MNRAKVGSAVGCLCLICVAANAQERDIRVIESGKQIVSPRQIAQEEAGDKDKKKDDKTAPPVIDQLTRPALETAEAPRAQSYNMIGDQGLYGLIFVQVPSLAKLTVPDGQGQTIDI